jgi:hypothetical protein
MANYYKGSVNGLAALRDAIFAACTAEGWTLTGDILSKDTMFIQIKVASPYLTFQGGTGIADGALSGATQTNVSIAETLFPNAGSYGMPSITWPANYEVFIFGQEVYVVLNYNVDLYQWAAWGKSTVSGLSGTGMWFGATRRSTKSSNWAGWSMEPNYGGSIYGAPALFWSGSTWYAGTGFESYVHSGVDEGSWYPLDSRDTSAPGIAPIDPLIRMLPNAWNSEAVLLPIRAYQWRASRKISLIADLEHARHVRMDNLEPGEIVTLGSEKWKVFPWYRKDAVNRNGGSDIKHSGTFGWAIRYVA